MLKKDKIFYIACDLSVAGIILAFMEQELWFMFFVTACLLRPALHEFSLGKQYTDERQLIIQAEFISTEYKQEILLKLKK